MHDPRSDPAPGSSAQHPQRDALRLGSTLQAVGLTFFAAIILLTVASFLLFPEPPEPIALVIQMAVLSLIVASLLLVRRGRIQLATAVMVSTTWLSTTVGIVAAGGIATPALSFYAVAIAAAGLLLGGRPALAMTALCVATSAVLALLDERGLLPEPVILYPNVINVWAIELTLFAAIGALILISVNGMRRALASAERSESDLAQRNLELSRTLAEKRRAEQGEALLHEAMGQASEAIVVLDFEGRIVYVNGAFQELTGRTDVGTEGHYAHEAFASIYRERRTEVLEALATGKPWHGRVRMPQPEDRLVDASMSLVTNDEGRTTHYVAVARDVTREAALELELRQSQKLEALGQLATGVAHDFNNLLSVIRGYADLLRARQTEAEGREAVQQIDEAAVQAAELTGQLLAFGRRQAHHPRVVDLNAVVGEAEGMLRTLLRTSIELELRLDPELGRVRLDPGQVHQILLNLAGNARDAMPRGGRLTLHTRALPDGEVELGVRDTGEGMDDLTQERIFEPFFTTKGPGQGTGLGLASVYGIVEQCGGSIKVESRLGRGTSFRLRFPSTDAPLAPSDGAAPITPSARQARVLVAEDQSSVRHLLGRQLRQAGHAVTLAVDGKDALQRVEQEEVEVDLLLTDVTMPRVGGAELAKRLRARFPGLRVLYTSGYWPDGLLAEIESDPRADFLTKPFARDEVLAKLGGLLARRPGD